MGRFIAHLGHFLKSMRSFVWPKLLGNFKGVKIFHFSCETASTILGDFLQTLGDILLTPSGHPGHYSHT